MALTTGCASGGFKLTRQYARFVNRQMIIIRIVLYLLTAIVFAATLLIDMVIFNTLDFWQGKVSEGTYDFKSGDKTYHVRHEILPETLLKRSTIQVLGQNQQLLQQTVLQETAVGEIEMLVDGELRTRVRDISGVPVASIFDAKGRFVEDQFVLFSDYAQSLIAGTPKLGKYLELPPN